MSWAWRWRQSQALYCVSADGELAIGVARHPNSIRIFSLFDDDVVAVVRNDHAAAITATAISCKNTIACTCSSDAVIFWKLDIVKSHKNSCEHSIGRTLPLTACKSVRHAAFSLRSLLAIVDDTGSIFLIEFHSGSIVNTLQFKSCCFVLFVESIFIALSEDGTFKIWSGEAYSELIYQSTVLCSSPLIASAAHPTLPRFTIASSNGYIFVFEYTFIDGCRYMGRNNIIERLQRLEEENSVGGPEIDSSDALIMSASIIGLSWSFVRETSMITVVTSTDVCIIQADSLSLSQRFPLEIPEGCTFVAHESFLYCVLTFAFSNQTSLLQFDVVKFKESCFTGLCLTSQTELSDSSPLLKSNFLRKPTAPMKKKPLDKPILFHKKVRSSGYGAPPANKYFIPKSSTKGKSSTKVKELKSEETSLVDYSRIGRIQVLDSERAAHNGPINAISFAGHGNSFLSCSTDSCVRLHRLRTTCSQVFTGHQASVKSALWSSDSKKVVTASADKTAAIYQLPRLDPVCRITHTLTNLSAKGNSDNILLPAEVNSARFFFQDTFVILCYGSDVSLYKYKLGTATSELNRPYQDYKFARVASYKHNNVLNGTVTQIACHNSKSSHLALASTRNRDLLVLDLSTGGSVINLINNAHDRPIHSICLNNLLYHVSPDIFCTAAADNTIKLWDIRLKGPVRRFVGHINRQKQVGLALSPCSKYIGTGSEDQHVYIYDLSNGRWLTRLRSQRDAISALSYCPTNPLLAAGAYDGTLVCYTS